MFYIYRTTNLINGKTYIGQHKKTNRRGKYIGSGLILRKAIKKYGKENFKVEILYDNIQLKETADSVEMFAIAKERKIGKAEYNIANGGQGGRVLNDEGEKMRIEKSVKTKKERAALGMYKGLKTGIKLSEETKQKIKDGWHEAHDGTVRHGKGGRFVKKDGTCKETYNPGSKGQHWFTNGITNVIAFECPEGFRPGKLPCSEESRKKMSISAKNRIRTKEENAKHSEALKGKLWFNDGKISVRAFECPEGFVRGRLKK
jgi:hypothetical protein